MAPYRKSTKVYTATFTVDGKRYYVRSKSRDEVKKKAKRREEEVRAALAAGMLPSADKMTVTRYIRDVWLKNKAPLRKTKDDPEPADVGWYKELIGRMELHVIPAIGTKLIKNVGLTDLKDILDSMACYDDSRKDGNGRSHPDPYSYSAIKKTHDNLKQIFASACADNYCIKDPALNLSMPDVKDVSRRALTDDELYLVLASADAMPCQSDRLFVLLVLFAGLRPQEVVALQWRHIHLSDRYIEVSQALKKDKKIGKTKTPAGVRDVPIPEYLACRLALYQGQDGDYVCTTRSKKAMKSTAIQCVWDRVKDEMEYQAGSTLHKNRNHRKWLLDTPPLVADDLTLYNLRHTYATYLQAAGVEYDVRVRLMGHKDPRITARYTHDNRESFEAARAKIDEFWKNKLKNVAPCVAPTT